ncbi:presenilin family intramembrane aspartyl protease PSH [Thermoplasma sp.]|uniref:presenilin family intramembrane aspartyl protease PSH n=1 Tax=Thermoplasma sp. TaxID=1973142 RepID=UPI0026016160|nr:presenilin family intramembrane aspartyl protease PSH [Thermoplasma sp.]
MRAKAELISMAIFVLSSLLAILLAVAIYNSEPSSYAHRSPTYGIGYVFIYIIAAFLFSFVIIYLGRKRRLRIFRVIYSIVVAYVIFYVFLILLSIFLYNVYVIFAASIAIAMIFFYLMLFRNEWYITDSAGFFLSVGISSIWGITFGVWAAVAFLVAFEIYDYIAVYKTKHMISLARYAVDSDLPMLFVLPENRGFSMRGLTFDNRGEGNVLMIGFGDIALPSIMVVSSAIYGIAHILFFTLLPLVGGLVGMAVLYFWNRDRPAPGLPYINTGTIVGFLIAFLVFRVF